MDLCKPLKYLSGIYPSQILFVPFTFLRVQSNVSTEYTQVFNLQFLNCKSYLKLLAAHVRLLDTNRTPSSKRYKRDAKLEATMKPENRNIKYMVCHILM